MAEPKPMQKPADRRTIDRDATRPQPDTLFVQRQIAILGQAPVPPRSVPAIADKVSHLTLFQRQPGWLLPKRDRGRTERERGHLHRGVLRKLYRFKLYAVQEMRELRGTFFRPGACLHTLKARWKGEPHAFLG